MNNQYSKLEEALRTYLNPTLELITQDADLSAHCYYVIKKYPAHTNAFWDALLHKSWSQLWELKLDANLLANLKLAQSKNDYAYIEYLLHHRPGKKLTLKLTRRNPIICESFTKAINLQNPGDVSAVIFKQLINQYIFNKKLQVKNKITLDQVLREVLKISEDDPTKELNFYQLHRVFNQKYLVDQN